MRQQSQMQQQHIHTYKHYHIITSIKPHALVISFFVSRFLALTLRITLISNSRKSRPTPHHTGSHARTYVNTPHACVHKRTKNACVRASRIRRPLRRRPGYYMRTLGAVLAQYLNFLMRSLRPCTRANTHAKHPPTVPPPAVGSARHQVVPGRTLKCMYMRACGGVRVRVIRVRCRPVSVASIPLGCVTSTHTRTVGALTNRERDFNQLPGAGNGWEGWAGRDHETTAMHVVHFKPINVIIRTFWKPTAHSKWAAHARTH